MRAAFVSGSVVFDLDGTIVDSCAMCVEILDEMLAERGSRRRIDMVAARPLMSKGGRSMVGSLLGSECVDPDAELAEFRARYVSRRTPVESLFPGAFDALQTLSDRGFSLSICSNKPQYLCERVLADTGISRFFTCVVGSQPGFRPKPAPDLLDACLDALAPGREPILYVGDSELDHQMARQAGLPFLLLSHGYAEEDWEPRDCEVFATFEQLTARILAAEPARHA